MGHIRGLSASTLGSPKDSPVGTSTVGQGPTAHLPSPPLILKFGQCHERFVGIYHNRCVPLLPRLKNIPPPRALHRPSARGQTGRRSSRAGDTYTSRTRGRVSTAEGGPPRPAHIGRCFPPRLWEIGHLRFTREKISTGTNPSARNRSTRTSSLPPGPWQHFR